MLKNFLISGLWLVVFPFFTGKVFSQQIFLKEKVRFSYLAFSGQTIQEHLHWLESEKGLIISYSSSAIDDQKTVVIKEGLYSIEDFLFLLLAEFDVSLTFKPPDKILIIPTGTAKKEIKYQLSGYIKDELSKEVLIGAVIESQPGGFFAFSNSSGYYILLLPEGLHQLEINYLGYKVLTTNIEINGNIEKNFFLEFHNELPAVTISQERISKERINYWNFGDQIDAFKSKEFKSLLGESDPINNVRVMPGVQSGGEGQSGLFVRGGGADQNLILMEGVPLYEASHTVGIASLFIEESIREASLIKNGFPARYGGRLSAVMDVHLKEGNTTRHERTFSVGIPGAKFHANGPIWKNKTTYNFSARTSWINYYINKFLVKYTNYDNITLDYRDIVGKITHRFSENHKISLSVYTGGDRLALQKTLTRDTTNYQFNSFDQNRLTWSNTLASAQWHYTPSKKWSFYGLAGFLSYKHRARSSYTFLTVTPGLERKDELDIFSYADILTGNVKFSADYFISGKHTLKFGTEFIHHEFNPVVKQSTIILQGEEANILDKDSVIFANEFNLFIEDHYRISQSLSMYAGVHFNSFHPDRKSYYSFQPRFNLVWKPFKNMLSSLAVTKMRQNIHLLVNLGIGLPSDLWVPSTDKVRPQEARQYSLSNSYTIDKYHFIQLNGFYKNFKGLLEFQSPVDLFYFFINDTDIVPVYNTSRDWERNVFEGSGYARGLEFLFQRKNKKINGWFSATWSKSERSFPDIENGRPFPFKYDRTWDINTGLSFTFSPSFSAAINFVYGTGNTFSLATEEYSTIFGTYVINSGTRNNRRLPDFHQMSLNFNYSRTIFKNGILNIHFNVYNVYNRLNSYFIYIYRNPVNAESFARKVSILPITPSLYFSVSF